MKNTYRPEIDGLRAIAVVSVILYHAKLNLFNSQLFKGGFIGVDIFFVISGYLISFIILNELITKETFSFKYFYERRIRRILPALLFVMLVSLPIAWIYLLPNNLVDFSKSIIYSLGFSSNFYFHYSGQEYDNVSGLLKPFLHTWSLSVEEQYYILFPIILLITFKYFKKYLLTILIFSFFISILIADWGSKNYSSATFYFIHTRMWELIAGSILAYLEITKGHRSKNNLLSATLPITGLILILHSIIFFDDNILHPSFYTLSPIIGVCFIIWFSNKDQFLTKILSTKLFVGIGLISYSLYLWHYPIFAFNRIIEFTDGSIFRGIFVGLLIVMLSIISYFFIERPARKKSIKFKIILSFISITFFILIFYNIFVISNGGYKNRLPEILNQKQDRIYDLLKNSKGETCMHNLNECQFNVSSKRDFHIIGDSHLATLAFDLKDRLIQKDFKVLISTFAGCLYFPGFNKIELKTNKGNLECNEKRFEKKRIELIGKESIVLIGGRMPLYLSNFYFDNEEGGIEGGDWGFRFVSTGDYKNIESSFKNEILKISKTNKVILVYPIPEVGWDPHNKIYLQWLNRNKFFNKNFEFLSVDTSYEVYKKRTQSSFELLDSIKGDNIYRVFPHRLFCNTIKKNRCVTHDGVNIFYNDADHPSLKGSRMINDHIMKRLEDIISGQ